jgi:hypothetical protein
MGVQRKGLHEDVRRTKRRAKRPCETLPAAVTGFTGSWDRAEGGRRNRIRLVLEWDEVTTDQAGRPANIRDYKLVIQYSADGTNWYLASRHLIPAADDEDPNNKVRFSRKGFHRKLQYRARVAPRSRRGCVGPWTAWLNLGSPGAEDPPAPSNVTIKRAPHGIVLDWDAPTDASDSDLFDEKVRHFVAELRQFTAQVKTFTASAATDTFTSTSHGFADGDRVHLLNTGSGLPGGVSAAVAYVVRDATANTFKLANYAGGPAINLTSDGDGSVQGGWSLAAKARHLHKTRHKFDVDGTDEDDLYYGQVLSVGADDDKSAWIPATAAGNSDPLAPHEGKRPKAIRHVWEFTINGPAQVQVYKPRARVDDDYKIRRVTVACDTPPSTGAARFDILVNGTSIFASDSDKPSVGAGNNDGSTKAIASPNLSRGDHIKVECEVANGIADVTLQVIGDRVG